MTARTSAGEISSNGRQLRAIPYPSAHRSSIKGVAGGGRYRYSATNKTERIRKPATQNATKRPSRRKNDERRAAPVTAEPAGRLAPLASATRGRGPGPLVWRFSMLLEYPTSGARPPRLGQLQLGA